MNRQHFAACSTPTTSNRVPGPVRRQDQAAVVVSPILPDLQGPVSREVEILYGAVQASTQHTDQRINALTQEVGALRETVNQLVLMLQNQQGPAVIESPGVSPIVAEPLLVAQQPEAQSLHSIEDIAVEPSASPSNSIDELPSAHPPSPIRRSLRQVRRSQAIPPRRPDPQPSSSRQPPPQRHQPPSRQASVEDDEDVPAVPYQIPDTIRNRFPMRFEGEWDNLEHDLQFPATKEQLLDYIKHITRDVDEESFVRVVYDALFDPSLHDSIGWLSGPVLRFRLKKTRLFKVICLVVRTRNLMSDRLHHYRWSHFIKQKRYDLRAAR